MTASDIITIVSTVAITQALCEVLAKKLVYSKDSYKRAIATFERAKSKRDKNLSATLSTSTRGSGQKAQSNASLKNAKKNKQIDDEYTEAAADVARRRIITELGTFVVFLILARILGMEYKGKIVGLLPFQPFRLLRRITMRGLHVDESFILPESIIGVTRPRVTNSSQVCGFLFIYILSTGSVKFAVSKLLGEKAPEGADKGLDTILEAPQSRKLFQAVGVDVQEFKDIKKHF
jgi:hypothetical protein